MTRPPPAWRRRQAGGAVPLIVAVGVCLVAGAAAVWAPAPGLAVGVRPHRPPARGLAWLTARGASLVDTAGRQVLLRGFNDSGLLQVGSGPPPAPMTASDAALMEKEGFDVVRLPISWSRIAPHPGAVGWRYLAAITRTVHLCIAHHLYVVIDMHTEDFGVGFGGIGAPAWLATPGVPNLRLPGLGPAWQRHASPAVLATQT